MKIEHKDALQERLAAEYVLGTLRGRARARFMRWLRDHAALRRAVAQWEARVAPMGAVAQPVQPPRRVWAGIAARLGTDPSPAAGGGQAFWRRLSFVTSGMAAALVAAVLITSPQSPTPAPAPVLVQAPPSNEMGASYLAVLLDPATQVPMLVLSAGRTSHDLWVKTLDSRIHVPEKSLELWALPAGQPPKSLGLVEPGEKMSALKLAAVADTALADIPMLAVSLEPRGGSPTGRPTGPVLYSGPCLKYW